MTRTIIGLLLICICLYPTLLCLGQKDSKKAKPRAKPKAFRDEDLLELAERICTEFHHRESAPQ